MKNITLDKPIKMIATVGVVGGFLSATGVANAQGFQLVETTIEDMHVALMSGEVTCRGLVESYLERIEAFDQQGPELNSVQHINSQALQEAEALDAAQEGSGLVGPLHCVPVLLKDQVETSDMPTTYGSAIFADFYSGRDATIVLRMKEAGAIILAKTNMGEFANGYLGSAFGMVRNAYEPARIPSGSSAGTGAGVAANLGLVGIGVGPRASIGS